VCHLWRGDLSLAHEFGAFRGHPSLPKSGREAYPPSRPVQGVDGACASDAGSSPRSSPRNQGTCFGQSLHAGPAGVPKYFPSPLLLPFKRDRPRKKTIGSRPTGEPATRPLHLANPARPGNPRGVEVARTDSSSHLSSSAAAAGPASMKAKRSLTSAAAAPPPRCTARRP